MRITLLVIGCALVALGAGIASANWMLEEGFGFQRKTHGPWSGWVRATAPEADPYTRAHFARNGELPPPPLEGLVFYADEDTDGEPLSGNCRYRFIGTMPPSRQWTITAFDSEGRLVPNPANRHAFSNGNVNFQPDGSVEVRIGYEPEPGNWLPIGSTGTYQLALALYDTPLATEAFLTDTALPAIETLGCIP